MSDFLIDKIEKFLVQDNLLEAKKELDLFLENNPQPDSYIHYLIALYHLKKEDYNLAIPHLLQIIQLDNQPYYLPKSYKLLVYCYLKQEKFWDARGILEKFMEEFYTDLQIKNMLAYSLFGLKQMGEALSMYQNIIAEDENNITARNGLAVILSEVEEKPQEALDILEPYANNDPRVLDTLGWAYFQLGNLSKAETYLRSAFEQKPSHPEINKHLTVVSQFNI